jgi:hypothetical protein
MSYNEAVILWQFISQLGIGKAIILCAPIGMIDGKKNLILFFWCVMWAKQQQQPTVEATSD